MILGVHHTGIATKDIDRLAAFYCNVLGMVKLEEGEWTDDATNDAVTGLRQSSARLMLLQLGNFCFELFEYRNPVGKPGDPGRPVCDAGITHFCLSVKDIDTEYARLSAAGMPFTTPPTYVEGLPFRATYGRDPDGNVIELLEIVGDTPFDYRPAPTGWRETAGR